MAVSLRLILVDDDKASLESLAKTLASDFDVHPFNSSDEALERIEEIQPDVVLTDVDMPGRNGYELCDEIKRRATTHHIPVIFFSDNDSVRERMVGYEMGGDDYLSKTLDIGEIKFKLQRSATRARHSRQLKASYESAQTTALEAMATNSELGKAVRYIEQSYTAAEFDTLGEMLAQFSDDVQLSAVVMFVCRSGLRFYTSNGKEVAPIEAQLMEKLHNEDRFIDFGCRTLVNYPQVALLIKNMPLDDREHYGRIKDIVPFALGATDAKVRMLDAEQALSLHCDELSSSIDAIQLTLDTIKDNYQNEISGVATIMSELRVTISLDMHRLDMTLEDETHLLNLIESTGRKLDMFIQENSATEEILNNVVTLLQRLTKEQNRIIADTLSSKNADNEDDAIGNVELF